LGRVKFTNDDGSGKFTQATLVRFEVEESFKGVPPGGHQIWADPGSFTSCYEEYHLGERYLIFAMRKAPTPNDAAAMTIMRDKEGKRKPFPPGFDPRKPPPVYYAPECAGSRRADYPNVDRDLAMLRAFRAGAALPRVLGNVYLYPFRGWPVLSGPALKGARITMFSGAVTLNATTNARGEFSLTSAPSGFYNTWADLPPYRMGRQAILHVPEIGCGYTDVQLTTTSTLQGLVLDHGGRPAPKIPIGVWLRDKKLEDATDPWALGTTTDENGQFTITGLPDDDVYISAGSSHPTTNMPYRRVYYPEGHSLGRAALLRLKPGEHRLPMVLCLEAPLDKVRARVHVLHKEGGPAANAIVNALNEDSVIAESERTDSHGVAEVPCLRGLKYEIEAHAVPRLPMGGGILKSLRRPHVCDGSSSTLELILDRSAPY
jgi:hypothetical protein